MYHECPKPGCHEGAVSADLIWEHIQKAHAKRLGFLTKEEMAMVAVVIVWSEQGIFMENLEGFPEDAIQISLEPGQDIQFLSEEAMVGNGWVRKQ